MQPQPCSHSLARGLSEVQRRALEGFVRFGDEKPNYTMAI